MIKAESIEVVSVLQIVQKPFVIICIFSSSSLKVLIAMKFAVAFLLLASASIVFASALTLEREGSGDVDQLAQEVEREGSGVTFEPERKMEMEGSGVTFEPERKMDRVPPEFGCNCDSPLFCCPYSYHCVSDSEEC